MLNKILKKTLLTTTLLLSAFLSQGTEKPSFLKTAGRKIVDAEGRQVFLRGCNAGAWLLIEPWIINIKYNPQVECEKDAWDIIEARFGKQTKLELIKLYRDNFFTEADVRRIAASGMNCLRLPVWWRATDDPAYGGDIKYIDNCVKWCAQNNIYLIIDLHGARGGQSKKAEIIGERAGFKLWKSPEHRQQVIEWWKKIAVRYKDETCVAGYDLLNEAMDAKFPEMIAFYDRLYREIRKIDPNHIIIMEDGLLGIHQMPQPEAMNWKNVAYSIHYYPQSMQDTLDAAAWKFHCFNRSVIAYDVPLIMGEFNTMMIERGGVDYFQRFIEIFDYYQWHWMFWTYKKIGDDFNIIWGLYGRSGKVAQIDPVNGSLADIRAALTAVRTREDSIDRLLNAALKITAEESRFKEFTVPEGCIPLSLRDAFLTSPGKKPVKTKWNNEYPYVEMNSDGVAAVWRVKIEKPGFYELNVSMGLGQFSHMAQVEIDGVEILEKLVHPTGGWHDYENRPVGSFYLASGFRVLKLRGPKHGLFNLRGAWLRPVRNGRTVKLPLNEITLDAFNMSAPVRDNPVRIEWGQNIPNIGYWESGSHADWKVAGRLDGKYKVVLNYSAPREKTVLSLYIGGKKVKDTVIPATGGWQKYRNIVLGEFVFPSAVEMVQLRWNKPYKEGSGNIRSLKLIKLTDKR